ncbi:MAG TPA: hypothetical protein VLC95_05240 [Anaerolineae bacterium]|nr:hypothetical protein [Anaerolineae bacterium]
MNKDTVVLFAALLLAGVLLFACPLPTLAAQTGTTGDVLLSTLEGDDYEVDVAHNSDASEFLAVWSSAGWLYGQRFDHEGLPLGEPFPIEDLAVSFSPAVAYSPGAGHYLVVWQHTPNGVGDIYGRLVTAGGALLGDRFLIRGGASDQTDPAVATDGTDFFVVWEQAPSGGAASIQGCAVFSDGSVGPVVAALTPSDGVERMDPALDYSPEADEYLAVFAHGQPNDSAIHARRVAPNASLPGAEYALFQHGNKAGSVDIAAAAVDTGGAYLVVWKTSGTGDSDIYGRVVLAGADSSFDDAQFPISDGATGYASYPSVARLPETDLFLVAWQDNRMSATSGTDIYGQRVVVGNLPIAAASPRSALGAAWLEGTNFALTGAPGEQWSPAVAGCQSPDSYLVVWDDQRSGEFDVYGQRVATTGSLLWYEFAVSAHPAAQALPAIAYGADQYLAVWQDQRDGHGAIVGQRLSSDGLPLEAAWVIHSDASANAEPTVAYNPTARLYLVIWADLGEGQLEAATVSPGGQGTAQFSIPDSSHGRRPQLAYDEVDDRFLAVWESLDRVCAQAFYGDGKPLTGVTTWLAVYRQGQVSHPALVFAPDGPHYLVTWGVDLVPDAIYGAFVDPDAALEGAIFTVVDGGTNARTRSSVAYNAAGQQYLVVYEIQAGAKESDIRGRLLDSSGAPRGDELIVRDQPVDTDHAFPHASYVDASGEYYVLWSEASAGIVDYDLYGLWLDPAGTPGSAVLPFFHYAGDQAGPRAAYDPVRSQGVVVWQDTRRTLSGDVYARRGTLDVAPPTALFTRDPTVGAAGSTFTFDARPSRDDSTPPGALRVRWDWTSDGSWDTPLSFDKVVTQTVDAPGIYTVTLEVWDLMWLTGTISLPVYVLPAGGNTAPEAHLALSPIVAAAGSSFQLDASASVDAETPPADLQVRWDWENDGAFDTLWSTLKVRSHVFTEAGLQLARVEVRDAGGLTGAAVAALLVLPGDVVTLTLVPDVAVLAPGETIQFHPTAWDVYGNQMSNPAVAWSVTDPLAGTISAGGWFTAGLPSGTYPGVVQATAGSGGDSATVTITWPYRVFLPLLLRSQ